VGLEVDLVKAHINRNRLEMDLGLGMGIGPVKAQF
jgi:hypothetical protein